MTAKSVFLSGAAKAVGTVKAVLVFVSITAKAVGVSASAFPLQLSLGFVVRFLSLVLVHVEPIFCGIRLCAISFDPPPDGR